MRFGQLASFSVILLILPSFITCSPNDQMHRQMDDLVSSVKSAVEDLDSKREVVDLGQSLHLLETKFSSLRAALSAEVNSRSKQFTSNANVAKELMDRAADLVRGTIAQRDEIKKLSSDVKQVDSAIRAFKEGVVNFERDAKELERIVQDLHLSHNDLQLSHEEAKSSVRDLITEHGKRSKSSSSTHWWFWVLLMIEVMLFVGFLYIRRPASTFAHKAYGKYG